FTHNSWIGDNTNSPIIGPAHKSGPLLEYSTIQMGGSMTSTIMHKDVFASNDPANLNRIQTFLMPYMPILETFWWSLWWGLMGYLYTRFLLLSNPRGNPHG